MGMEMMQEPLISDKYSLSVYPEPADWLPQGKAGPGEGTFLSPSICMEIIASCGAGGRERGGEKEGMQW